MESTSTFETRTDLSELHQLCNKIKGEIAKVIVGQEKNIDLLLVGLFAKGHVLIEGVPGVAKTLSAKLIAKSISSAFSRIQFTPDLMPSDVVGTTVFNASKSEFEFNRGPVFSNIILIDEINRAPAKTQAALFEVMEEYQVSVDGTTYPMEFPFWVLATQNPVEQEGTYQLPEAQLDRFMMKIEFGYPSEEEEINILMGKHANKHQDEIAKVEGVINATEIKRMQDQVQEVHLEENLVKYIVQLIQASRSFSGISLGASPRASIAVMNAAKAMAAIRGRDFVTPDDVKAVLPSVLHHRIILSPEREMEGITPKEVLEELVRGVEIPR